jgi:hypothetical protein
MLCTKMVFIYIIDLWRQLTQPMTMVDSRLGFHVVRAEVMDADMVRSHIEYFRTREYTHYRQQARSILKPHGQGLFQI